MHPLVDAFYKGRERFKKKSIGKYFDRPTNPRAACHIGSIYWGLYKRGADLPMARLITDYPEEMGPINMVPIPCEHAKDHLDPNGFISSILVHLSDEHTGHDWPDKRVAEWMESVLVQ